MKDYFIAIPGQIKTEKLTEKHISCVGSGNEALSSIFVLEEPFFLHILASQMTHCKLGLSQLIYRKRFLIDSK